MRETSYWVGGKTAMEMTASHMMEKEVISFEGGTSCHALAETMVEENLGSIPIVDRAERLIGIVSEYDLLDAMRKGKELSRTTANEVMTQPAIAIPEEMPAEEINALLHSRHLIRVPVVDPENRLIGILARRDILGCYVVCESAIGPLAA